MISRSRLFGLALALTGASVALFGPFAGEAQGYTTGHHRGYVGTRGVVLEEGKPVWAVYAADQTLDGGKFVPGAVTRLQPATGDYEEAVVLSRDEVQFAVQQYEALRVQYAGKYELLTRAEVVQARFKDREGNNLELPALSPRTTHIIKLKSAETEPKGTPLLAQFPLHPDAVSASQLTHLTYLVQNKGATPGRVLHSANGIITYLSAFFSEVSNDAPVAWGHCNDFNGADLNNVSVNGVKGRDDLNAFDACDAGRVGRVWGPIVGAWVDSGSRWMIPGNHGVQTNFGQTPDALEGGQAANLNYAGRYDLDYPYIEMSQFWDTMYVTLNFQPFDIRSQLGARWVHRKRVQAGATLEVSSGAASAYANSFTGMGYGSVLGSLMPMTMSQWNGGLIDTKKWRSVNFGIEVAHTNGYIKYVNEPRPNIPLLGEVEIRVNENDPLPKSLPPHYGHPPPSPKRSQVAIDLSTGQPALPGATGPIVKRVQVPGGTVGEGSLPLAPDGTLSPVYDASLVQDMGRSDFANTDIHVFGPTGDLITTRIGLRQNESPGLLCQRNGSDPFASPTCTVAHENPTAETRIADFIRNRYPGARYRVVVINRSTGYVGTGFVKVGSEEAVNGLNSFVIEGNDGLVIKMRPPNLKVEVKRVPTRSKPLGNDLCASLAPNEECEQLIGFEGGALTDDERIVITTTWLDWNGSPLPANLPGFTGRLSRVVDEAKLGPADAINDGSIVDQEENGQGKLGQFNIPPGKKTQVVRLADPRAYHYYLHVSGANNERCGKAKDDGEPLHESWEWFTQDSPSCASFAKGIDDTFDGDAALGYRPGRFVPVLVPVFDAARTAEIVQQEIGKVQAAAVAAAANNQPPPTLKVPKVPPIYRDVYRAEQQFSVFELQELDAPELVTKYDQKAGNGKTTLSFGYDISTADQLSGLDPYGPDQDLIWSLGFEELLAMVNDQNAKVGTCTADSPPGASCFHDLETLLLLSPAAQLGEVENAASLLSPQDYLALQLYLGNDKGNALYADYDIPYPLVYLDVSPIELKRRENLTRFGPGVVPPPSVEDDYKPIPFEVTRPACLTIRAKPHQGSVGPAPSVELFAKARLLPNSYYYVLDGGELAEKGVRGNFTLELIAETCGSATNGGTDGESQFRVHRSEIEVTQESVRSSRGLGEIVEHDVNVLDGSLRLSRQDFAIGGKGPALALVRSYTNLGTDADGALGTGWSHSFDLQLVPTSTDETGNLSVPSWVSELRSEVTACPNGQCIVAQKLFPTQPVQVTGIFVNGTSFRHTGQQQWVAQSGHHSELIQHCTPQAPTPECFEFKSKDGTSYFYDYPSVVAPAAGQKDPNPTMVSLQDGLAQRLAWFNLRYRQANAQTGRGGVGMKPTLLRRIKDRFDYELKFRVDAKGRVEKITESDRGSDGRSCRFAYEGEGPDAPVGCEHEETGFERLRSVICLEGQTSPLSGNLQIKIDYCYDERGNLASARRGRQLERYEYESEVAASPDAERAGGNPNLVATIVENDGVEQRTTYSYREDVAPHTYVSGALPAPVALFDMVDSVTYPPTAPMPSEEAEATVAFAYGDLTRTVGDARGPPHQGRKYTLNTLGNPTEIEEAGRKTTTMEWSFDVGSSGCGPTTSGDNQMVSRTVEVEEGRSVTTTFAYDADGNVTRECMATDEGSLVTEQRWNPLAQLEYRKDFRGVEESWDYGADGLLESHTNGAGIVTTYVRSVEHRGRVGSESVQGDVNQTTEHHYDQFGNVTSTSISGVAGTTTSSHFDARSRLERQTDPLGRATTYEYDTNDNLRFTRLPSVAQEPFAALTTLEVTYDAVGNKKSENDRNGLRLEYEYTARNQVESVRRITTGLNGGTHAKLQVRPARQHPSGDGLEGHRHQARVRPTRLSRKDHRS